MKQDGTFTMHVSRRDGSPLLSMPGISAAAAETFLGELKEGLRNTVHIHTPDGGVVIIPLDLVRAIQFTPEQSGSAT